MSQLDDMTWPDLPLQLGPGKIYAIDPATPDGEKTVFLGHSEGGIVFDRSVFTKEQSDEAARNFNRVIEGARNITIAFKGVEYNQRNVGKIFGRLAELMRLATGRKMFYKKRRTRSMRGK